MANNITLKYVYHTFDFRSYITFQVYKINCYKCLILRTKKNQCIVLRNVVAAYYIVYPSIILRQILNDYMSRIQNERYTAKITVCHKYKINV